MTKLYVTTISSAKARDKDYKLGDGAGLYLLVRPNGSKLWRLNYSWLGKQKTLALGQWPELSLADARDKRDEARRLLALGVDPSHQQKVDAAKARIEDDNTFKAVAKEWIAKQEREEMAEIMRAFRVLLDSRDESGSRPPAPAGLMARGRHVMRSPPRSRLWSSTIPTASCGARTDPTPTWKRPFPMTGLSST